jgi:hypothetical protein
MNKIIGCILMLVWTTIYWDAVQNTDLSLYSVERKTTTGSWKEVAQTNKGVEQCRVSGSKNRTYGFRVLAVDVNDNKGNPSSTYTYKFE